MNDEFGLPGVEGARDLNPAVTDGESPVTDEVEFVPESEPEPAPRRPPGPGLPEALLWTLGIFITLLVAGGVWTVLFMLVLMMQGYRFNPGSDIDTMMNGLSVNTRVMLLLPSNVLAFIVLIPLGLWRLGRDRFRKLNFSPPSLTQFLIVLAAVYPTTIISTPAFEVANHAWTDFSAGKPWLEAFNEQTSVMQMMEYLGNGSLVLLLFFLAVVPAIGEEFMFRGLLGRGLTARWGVWRGVLMTSVLFALLHTYPPHIAAVLPIGIMMHIVYLTTRSFWAPMLFHFANNAMAATYTALGLVGEDEMPIWMPVAALAYVLVSIALLYRYRTRYVNDEGEEIGPGYVTVSAPPPETGARRLAPVGWVAAPLFAIVLAATGYLLVSDLVQSLDAKPQPAETESARHADPGVSPQPAVARRPHHDLLHSPVSRHDGRIIA